MIPFENNLSESIIGYSLFVAFFILVYFFIHLLPLTISRSAQHAKIEVATGLSVPAQEIQVPYETILFSAGSVVLNENQKKKLARFLDLPRAYFFSRVLTIQGMADASGNQKQNLNLAKSRAQVVIQYLLAHGMSKENIRMLAPKVKIGQNKLERQQLRAVTMQFLEKKST